MPRRFADAETISATGAFLVGELERLDARVYEPIADFTYGRDIDPVSYTHLTLPTICSV